MSDIEECQGRAMEFLKEQLAAGPVRPTDLAVEARELGISEATLRRARTDLGVVVQKTGHADGWELRLLAPVISEVVQEERPRNRFRFARPGDAGRSVHLAGEDAASIRQALRKAGLRFEDLYVERLAVDHPATLALTEILQRREGLS